jgi:hypothetical protein
MMPQLPGSLLMLKVLLLLLLLLLLCYQTTIQPWRKSCR